MADLTVASVLKSKDATQHIVGAIQSQFDMLFASSCSSLSRDAHSLIPAAAAQTQRARKYTKAWWRPM
jgi:hypothetical protein